MKVGLTGNQRNVSIAPPLGEARIIQNPMCAQIDCVAPDDLAAHRDAVLLSLAPDGVLSGTVHWKATYTAWPPPQKEVCCTLMDLRLRTAGPLPRGTYRVEVAVAISFDASPPDASGSTARYLTLREPVEVVVE
jgi:hypothetical protein